MRNTAILFLLFMVGAAITLLVRFAIPAQQPALDHRAGAIGDTIEVRLHFREFVRLEIGNHWFRVSEFLLWRLHSRMRKVWVAAMDDANGNGVADGTEGHSDDNASVSDETNLGWE